MNQQQHLSSLKKRLSGHFSLQDKERILNIFKVSVEQNSDNTKTENVAFTAKAAGNVIIL